MKLLTAVLFISGVALYSTSSHGDVRKQVIVAAPTFSCAATPSGNTGNATITHENAVEVSKTNAVTATVKTAAGDVSVVVCGSAFATSKSTSISFPISKVDKNWIYTCTAKISTSACPTPLH